MKRDNNNIDLTEEQQRVLEMSLEFYIRLGLGQFGEIATRFNLLHGNRLPPEKIQQIQEMCQEMQRIAQEDRPWRLTDEETSLYTLTAFLMESKMTHNTKGTKWVTERIKQIVKNDKEKIM